MRSNLIQISSLFFWFRLERDYGKLNIYRPIIDKHGKNGKVNLRCSVLYILDHVGFNIFYIENGKLIRKIFLSSGGAQICLQFIYSVGVVKVYLGLTTIIFNLYDLYIWVLLSLFLLILF